MITYRSKASSDLSELEGRVLNLVLVRVLIDLDPTLLTKLHSPLSIRAMFPSTMSELRMWPQPQLGSVGTRGIEVWL